MKINFDKKIKVAGIGLVPWTRLGPEMWLENYAIASLYGWDLGGLGGAPKVVPLSDSGQNMPELKRQNTQSLIRSEEFQRLLLDNFRGHHLLTYKPVKLPQVLQDTGMKLLAGDQILARKIENKAEFRRLFAGLGVPFPAFEIIKADDLQNYVANFEDLMCGRKALIIQDASLTGGKGTKLIKTPKDLEQAIADLKKLSGASEIVISDYIADAFERSVQCCVTKYGIFIGPLQKQIVGNPLLSNLGVPEGDRFCGAEITKDDQLLSIYPKIRAQAHKIGSKLKDIGYKGIFGLDCLVTKEGKMFVLEANPRITGVTPLLTMLHREGDDIPFYLLHILELGGFEYKIDDDYINTSPPEGSLMVLHSQSNKTVNIKNLPKSGVYNSRSLKFIRDSLRLDDASGSNEWLVQRYTPPGFKTKPGGRIMMVYVKGKILDEDDKLLPEVAKGVSTLLQAVSLEELG